MLGNASLGERKSGGKYTFGDPVEAQNMEVQWKEEMKAL